MRYRDQSQLHLVLLILGLRTSTALLAQQRKQAGNPTNEPEPLQQHTQCPHHATRCRRSVERIHKTYLAEQVAVQLHPPMHIHARASVEGPWHEYHQAKYPVPAPRGPTIFTTDTYQRYISSSQFHYQNSHPEANCNTFIQQSNHLVAASTGLNATLPQWQLPHSTRPSQLGLGCWATSSFTCS